MEAIRNDVAKGQWGSVWSYFMDKHWRPIVIHVLDEPNVCNPLLEQDVLHQRMIQMIYHPGVTDEQLTELAICCSSDMDIVKKIAQRLTAINHTIHLLDELCRKYVIPTKYTEIINDLVVKVNRHEDKIRIVNIFHFYGNIYALRAMHVHSDYRLPYKKIYDLFERHPQNCIVLKICKDYYRDDWDTLVEVYRGFVPHGYHDYVRLLSVGYPLTMNEHNLRSVLSQLFDDERRAVELFHTAGSEYTLVSFNLLQREAFLYAIDCWNIHPASLAHLHHFANRRSVLILLSLGIAPPPHYRTPALLEIRRENLQCVSNSMLAYRIPRDVFGILERYCEL
jgi:hypothetical protein